MTEIKGLICGAYEDAPFLDIGELAKGRIAEVDYFSDVPFICLTELGAALTEAITDADQKITKAKVITDKKEPMNIYDLTIETGEMTLHLISAQYLKPGRQSRPPQGQNRSAFPWGYSIALDISGDDCACACFLTHFLIRLKRNPWEGIVWDEFPSKCAVTQEAAQQAWLNAIAPIYENCQERLHQAKELKLKTGELELLMGEAKAALDAGKTAYFLGILKKMDLSSIETCVNEQRRKGQDISKQVLSVQERLREAGALGLDTTNPEHYLSNAKRFLLDKKWDEAKDNLKKAEDTIEVLRKASRPDIQIRLDCPNNAVTGKSLPITLELTNIGNLPALGVAVEIEGGLKVNYLSPPTLLPPGPPVRIDATVTAPVGGFKTLEVKITYSRSFDGQQYSGQTSQQIYFADTELKIGSKAALTVVGGFAQLGLELRNDYMSDITEVRLELLQDPSLLPTVGIEPPMDMSKGAFIIGTLRPKQEVNIKVQFDPLLPKPAQLKGSLSFTDIKGQPRHFLFSTPALGQVAINCVMGEVPSAKSLVERFATTHHHEFGKLFALPLGLTANTAYRVAKNCILALPASLVLDGADTSSKDTGTAGTKDPMEDTIGQSWFTVQDQEPGNCCLVYLRAWQGLSAMQVLVASPNLDYSRCLLLHVQAILEAQLFEDGILSKDQHLQQIPGGYLRERIMATKLGLIDSIDLSDLDMSSKLQAAAMTRENTYNSLRDLELRAGKEIANKGRVRRKGV